jgi:RNA polymerase sigma factor (TIGR02999 family)
MTTQQALASAATPDFGCQAHGTMFARLYDELRRIAQREVRRSAGLSVSATTLVHEAYFKVRQQADADFPDPPRFLAYAAQAMRSLVIDFARNQRAQKRGGEFQITQMPTELPEQAAQPAEIERLSDAIDRLAELDPVLAQLVDLKFFCGYSLIEIASMRNVSERTAQRDWDKARVLLKRALEGRGLLPA